MERIYVENLMKVFPLAQILAVLTMLGSATSAAAGQTCTFTLSRSNVLAGPEGPIFGVTTVTASAPSCTWSASTPAPWVLLHTGTTSGTVTGSGNLAITLQANTTGATRVAAVAVAGLTVNVTQQATACVTSLTPSALEFPYPGFGDPADQAKQVIVDAPADCHWQHSPWPIYLGPNPTFGGVGPGVVNNIRIITIPNGASNPVIAGIGSVPLTLTRLEPPCVFTLDPPTATVSVNGGSGTINVTGTGTDCHFTATTTAADLTLTQSGPETPATISYTVAPSPASFPRIGSILVPNAGTVITQNGAPARTDVPYVSFGALSVAGALTVVSPPEDVQLTIDEQPSSAWTATSTQPWLVVSPTSGAGPATLRLSVDETAAAALAPGAASYAAEVRITAVFAPATAVRRLGSAIFIKTPQTATIPTGVFETPVNNTAGASGAIPVTGWALDDIDVSRIQIFRDPVGNEIAEVFIGDAVRVKGARPDIAIRQSPQARRAGWGYMLLSNVLPGGGNGPFTFSAYVDDVDGHRVLLGRKTVTFDNAGATRPFGTIDTPAQGQTVSGTINHFGWALTTQPKMIPLDGSTIDVYIDGVPIGPVTTYNAPRPDVTAFFPGLMNSAGPGAHMAIDTTLLADGVHTIAWSVFDDGGAGEGLGSRYFTVDNGASSLVAAPAVASRSAQEVDRMALVRKGREIRIARGGRVEVSHDPWSHLCGTYSGFLMTGGVAGPLPAGASLDPYRGIFTWQPPVEFAGRFEFVFVLASCTGGEQRIPLRVVIGD